MAVIISGGSLEERRAAARELGKSFLDHPDHLEAVLSALPTDVFVSSGLYFLPQETLKTIDQDSELALKGTRSIDLSRQPNLDYLTEELASSTAGSELLLRGLEAFVGATSVRDKKSDSQGELIPKLMPESEQLSQYLGDLDDVPTEAFFSLDGGRTILVLVRPKIGTQSLEAAGPAVAEVRQILSKLREDYHSLTLSLTGEPVLVVDERKTIAQDSVRGTVCSLLLVIILFQFGFREFLRPALALSTLTVGLLWTLGVISVSIGHLNFITITYVPILVGIGLDFGIHMAFRYYEHRQSETPEQSIEAALEGAGKDTFFGALTTSASFGVLWAIGFRGVSELGAIALVGVLLCQLSSCTFMPAMLAWLEKRGTALPENGRQELCWLEEQLSHLDKPILFTTLILVICSVFLAPTVGFNVHLLKMQNPELESVQTELRLVAEGKSSVLTALVAAPNLETARQWESALREKQTVAEVISLATFLPRVTPEKVNAVHSILARRDTLIALLHFLKDTPPARAKEALRMLERFSALNLPTPKLQIAGQLLSQLQRHLKQRGPGPVMDSLEGLRSTTLDKLTHFEPLLKQQDVSPLSPEALPETLKGRLLRTDGQFVLKIFPQVDIWQPENLHRFLQDVREVTPDVSGEPVLIELFERLVMRTHWRGITLSLLVMTIVLIVILRDTKDVILAASPTAISLLLVMGLMGFLGWDFNPANFVAVPMLLGIGSVFGLHSVIRMRELGHERILSCSTGPAIILSAATSMAGFASLGLADHRGIASLGWVVSIGLFINTLLSISVLPAWLRARKAELEVEHRREEREP